MNDDKIEELLRKAPAVSVPAGLLRRLQAGIRLPRAQTNAVREFDSRPWLRRWLPAVSFAVFFLGCLVVIGVQTSVLSELKRENAELRGAGQNLEQLRADNADYQRLRAQSQELERLRADNADLKRLRDEVAQLQAQVKEAENLRVENQKLRQENAARLAQATGGLGSLDDAIAKAKLQAERAACVNNLKQIGLAFRTWAGDYNGLYPDNFLTMSNEIYNPKLLGCPADTSRSVTNWADVAAGNVSYRIVSTGPDVNDKRPDLANLVIVLCPIHGSVCLGDGSVQMLGTNAQNRLQVVDGKTYLVK